MQARIDERCGQALHDGVLAAVTHVAAAGATDTKELTLELLAANIAVKTCMRRVPKDSALERTFRDGLSLDRLKELAPEYWRCDFRLEWLRYTLHLMETGASDLVPHSAYRELVLAAAKAAIRAEKPSRFIKRGWRTYTETVALREIEEAIEMRRNECARQGPAASP
jgi:hypothetical protein